MTLKEEIVLDLTMRGGHALVELREQAGLSREVLAVRVGRASSTVELWERLNKPIKNTDILRLADQLAPKIAERRLAGGNWSKARYISQLRLRDAIRPKNSPQYAYGLAA